MTSVYKVGGPSSATIRKDCVDNRSSYEDSLSCLQNISFTKEEIIYEDKELYDVWKECTTPFWRGRTFYRKIHFKYYAYNFLRFVNDGKVSVEIFDPNFMFMTEKYLTVPRISPILKKNAKTWINIKVEKVHNLRTSNQDCIDSLNYSFTSCIEVKF